MPLITAPLRRLVPCLPASALALLCLCSAGAGASGLAVVVLDVAGKPLADVVVYAEADGAAAPPKTLRAGSVEQKGLQFIPLVTVVQTGSLVSFPNNDKVRHHIYSFSAPHKFDQKLYSGTTATPQLFDKPGTVVLGCNIHDNMLAYIRIVDTPYFAKTDASGAAKIEIPAAGKYIVKAWHYNSIGGSAAELPVLVKAGDLPTPASFKLALKPAGAEPAMAAPNF